MKNVGRPGHKVIAQRDLGGGRHELTYGSSGPTLVRPTTEPARVSGTARPRVSSSPGELPEIRSNERVSVELSVDALETIKRSLFVFTNLGAVETGGFLFGHEADGVLHITSASTDAEQQGPSSVLLAREPRDAVGHWHSHPDERGLELSSADWASATERAQSLRTLSLVVGRNDGRTLVRGYDLRSRGGRVVASPVQIVDADPA